MPGAGTSDPSVSLAVIDNLSVLARILLLRQRHHAFPMPGPFISVRLVERYLSCWNFNSRGIVEGPSLTFPQRTAGTPL